MHEGLSLRYQPIVNATSGRLVAVEALLRRGTERDAPVDLLEAAAACGEAETLDRAILARTCVQIAAWEAEGLFIPVHVNISAATAAATDAAEFAQWLRRQVRASTSVTIEVTETTNVREIDALAAFVTTSRAAGFEVAIDDFGCGYSTLALLQTLRADVLKLDRRFVSVLDEDGWTRTIVRHLISLAHDLGMRVIGEGVETKEQGVWLRRFDCDEFQGYAIAQPLPSGDLPPWARQRMSAGAEAEAKGGFLGMRRSC
ncbi:MAG: EAL domain-containing protein [Vulcanimicrobiaceae bacterium]|jgi:EAL domain-containing protein (putative c-di-GMP-specific phosphodiesterase class I)